MGWNVHEVIDIINFNNRIDQDAKALRICAPNSKR